jgi:5'-3' exonuclease
VGDAADGYPGIAGIGPKGAAGLIGRYGKIESFPPEVLSVRVEMALLFKTLATLRTDAPTIKTVNDMQWHGPTPRFAECCENMGNPQLLSRAQKAFAAIGHA